MKKEPLHLNGSLALAAVIAVRKGSNSYIALSSLARLLDELTRQKKVCVSDGMIKPQLQGLFVRVAEPYAGTKERKKSNFQDHQYCFSSVDTRRGRRTGHWFGHRSDYRGRPGTKGCCLRRRMDGW